MKQVKSIKDLKPTNDWIFKKIYGGKDSKRITEQFIKAYLDLEVKIKEIQNQQSLENNVFNEKAGVLDVLVETEDGTQIDLEMQVGNYQFVEVRLTKYACQLFADGIEKGEYYDKSRKTIAVMFVTGELERLKKYPEYSFKWNLREEKYHDLILTENLEIVIISLGKIRRLVRQGKIDEKEKLAIWTKFLLNPKELGAKELEENEEIKEANEKYEEVMTDMEAINLAIRREQYLNDIASFKHEGEVKGIEKGEKKKSREIAKKMLMKNKPIEEIIEFTELTKEEIEELK